MISATPTGSGTYDFEPYRRRLGIAVLISLTIHSLLLSLEFGIPGSGRPGQQSSSWGEHRVQGENLHLRLAETNRSASATAESGAATGSASAAKALRPNSASDIAVQATDQIFLAQATENKLASPPSRKATSTSLAVLPDQKNEAPVGSTPPRSVPLVASEKTGVKQSKARSKAGKKVRRNTMLAKKNTMLRPSGAWNNQGIAAQPTPQTDSFTVPVASESKPEQSGTEAAAMQETTQDTQPPELAEDAPTSSEPLIAGPDTPPEPERAQTNMAPLQAAASSAKEAPAEEQAMLETQAQSEAARQQEKEKIRLAEELSEKIQAEENEKRQAMERERQHAEEEARRLAEQEERHATEARELAAREMEEAAHRAEIEAQRQAELLAHQQAAQGLEEERRRQQELADRMKAEEEARHALAAEEQRRAELAAREQAAAQMRAEAEREAHQRAIQEQQAAAARQAEQASLGAQENAQESAAQARAQAEEMIRRSSAGHATPGESHGSSMPAASADASGNASEERTGMRESEVPRNVCTCFRCFSHQRSESEAPRKVCFCVRCYSGKSKLSGRRQ